MVGAGRYQARRWYGMGWLRGLGDGRDRVGHGRGFGEGVVEGVYALDISATATKCNAPPQTGT